MFITKGARDGRFHFYFWKLPSRSLLSPWFNLDHCPLGLMCHCLRLPFYTVLGHSLCWGQSSFLGSLPLQWRLPRVASLKRKFLENLCLKMSLSHFQTLLIGWVGNSRLEKGSLEFEGNVSLFLPSGISEEKAHALLAPSPSRITSLGAF